MLPALGNNIVPRDDHLSQAPGEVCDDAGSDGEQTGSIYGEELYALIILDSSVNTQSSRPYYTTLDTSSYSK